MKQIVKCLTLCFCKYLSLQHKMQKYIMASKFKMQSLDYLPLLLLAAKGSSIVCPLLWLSVIFNKLAQTLVALMINIFYLPGSSRSGSSRIHLGRSYIACGLTKVTHSAGWAWKDIQEVFTHMSGISVLLRVAPLSPHG